MGWDQRHQLIARYVLWPCSDSTWQEVCDHAERAVEVDNWMRAYHPDRSGLGLLFPCKLGR